MVILTKMVVWTILGHFGPAHIPTVQRPLLIQGMHGVLNSAISIDDLGTFMILQGMHGVQKCGNSQENVVSIAVLLPRPFIAKNPFGKLP